jgi:cytochrome b involved in lipid metabolism
MPTGTDATDAFEDIGHSNGAKKLLVEKCELKGDLVGAPEKKKAMSGGAGGGDGGVKVTGILIPVLAMAVLAFLVQKFM